MLEGWEKVSRLEVQRWDELGANRNAKVNYCSGNSKLGEAELVSFLFCGLMHDSCCLL